MQNLRHFLSRARLLAAGIAMLLMIAVAYPFFELRRRLTATR